jgi:hypothetical protein
MNAHNDEKIRKLLQSAFPPLAPAELKRDLWPTVLRRLDEDALRVPWFDWALASLLGTLLLLYPEAIPVLFYYL